MLINEECTIIIYSNAVNVINEPIKILNKSVSKDRDDIEGLIVGNNVEEIEDEVFYDCKKLEYVILGRNIKRIGQCAFTGNDNLKFVAYRGIIEEYTQIEKGEPFENVGVIHCIDGLFYTANY